MPTQPTIVAIIQARMTSTRLPAKVLADIVGHPMLWHVVNRVRLARSIDQVVVATSIEPADDAIAQFCRDHRIEYFRGSEVDVLDRFYQAAKSCDARIVVRITADCPLIDPHVIDTVVNTFCAGGADYVTNTLRYTYPDGLDTEVCSFAALETAWNEAHRASEREHVTSYLRNSGRFRVANVESDNEVSARHLRWTVDEPHDLEFVRAIYSRLWPQQQAHFFLADILQLLEREPQIMKINQGIPRNEGYYTSLMNEPPVNPQPRELKRSYALKVKATRLIPSGSQTFSKSPSQFVQGVAPVFLSRGQGSYVWDVDGNQYIDYAMALGPVILGHNYPVVTEAVTRQMADGTVFSLPHPLEVDVAEALVMLLPCAEMVQRGRTLVDGHGADRVVMAMRGDPLRLRTVETEDCRLLWEWANDPDVRAVSFSSATIPWPDHLRWFHAKLQDAHRLFFVATDTDDIPVGQVRYDLEDGHAVISISLDRRQRSKGYGSALLRLAAHALFATTTHSTIHAYVKPENQASVRAFERTGYANAGMTMTEGQPAILLILEKNTISEGLRQ